MTADHDPPKPDGDEAVGYKRPPTRTRFQQDHSGNPKGRPKGSKNLNTLFAEELARPITLTENGKPRRVTKREALVKQTVNKALGADTKATALLFDQIRRGEGTAEAPAAAKIERPEDNLVIENIVRRISLAYDPDAAANDVDGPVCGSDVTNEGPGDESEDPNDKRE